MFYKRVLFHTKTIYVQGRPVRALGDA